MATTAVLGITLLEQNQSQPEVTVNGAIKVLDANADGRKDITMTDANYTIGTTGVPAEYQHHHLKMDGPLTAPRDVIFPTAGGLGFQSWVFENDTAHLLTAKYSSGNGIVVLPGQTEVIRGDGTNIFLLGANYTREMFAYRQTTDGSMFNMLTGPAVNRELIIPIDTAVSFFGHVVARRTDVTGTYGRWTIQGLITRETNTTTLQYNSAVKDHGSYTVALAADDATHEALDINVTGTAGHTVQWTANLKYVISGIE